MGGRRRPRDAGPARRLQVTPIHVGDALYVCNAHNAVISLDAETGRERWRFDMTGAVPPSGKPCRGVSYYRAPGATGVCAERILATSQTPELFALDAATGRPCSGFGDGGRVRLLEGLGDVPVGYHYVSSAPQIVRGKVVFGGAIMDGQYWGEPSGVIRAFDAVTGRLAWAFDRRPARSPWRAVAGRDLHAGDAEQLGADQRRRGTRPCLPADRQCDARLLRRAAPSRSTTMSRAR